MKAVEREAQSFGMARALLRALARGRECQSAGNRWLGSTTR
jgi:hypothetical protein